jgi:hypothetical protein
MKTQDFTIKLVDVGLLFLIAGLFIIAGALLKVKHDLSADNILIVGITCSFIIWVIVLRDIINNRLQNKTFWILSMLVLPGITPLIYLIRRNALLISR